MVKKEVMFHHDNGPANSSAIAQQKLAELKLEILPYPSYSPDLPPTDLHPFPKLKTFLGRGRFRTNEKAIEAVNDYFEDLKERYFQEGTEKLEKRWITCVEL